MRTGQDLYLKARELIPGGTQFLTKRPEMFLPEQWPAYYSKAKGVEIWDLDGTKYIDTTQCGAGGPILGYADSEVDDAVISAIRSGMQATLNCPEEVELAELLLELHPWADMVRYARTGGEIMAAAARIARASTGREKIAFCGYHGWHDWYLAANLADGTALDGQLLPGLEPLGVPRGLAGTMLPFHYNQIDELRAIVDAHGHELAAIFMEPARSSGPVPGFLEEARETASSIGALLVFDEVMSGWRMTTGGIHRIYGVTPDLCSFSKAMANGYPMSALIGKRPVMEVAQSTFISSTNWSEKIGPTAALATTRKHLREDVPSHLIHIGTRVQKGLAEAAQGAGLRVNVAGLPPLTTFSFDYSNGLAITTLFIQEMLDRGFLSTGAFNATYSHQPHHIESYLQSVQEVFRIIAQAIENESVEQLLRGPVKHSSFQRLT